MKVACTVLRRERAGNCSFLFDSDGSGVSEIISVIGLLLRKLSPGAVFLTVVSDQSTVSVPSLA